MLNRNMIILIILIIVLLLNFNFIKNKLFKREDTILEDVKLKEVVEENSLFAVKVEQLDGTYIEQSGFPLKEDGYIYNATLSGCVDSNGEIIENAIAYRNNMVRVKTRSSSYCYLYFDLISDGDFCIEQGITNLRDCLLVMEDYSYDTEEAIEYINNKGNATTSKIAPTITYVETTPVNKVNSNGVISSTSNFTFGSSYTFDSSTGNYILKNYVTTTMSDDYIGYYTCGATNDGSDTCPTMYKINAYTKTVNASYTTYKITDADVYIYKATDTFDSEVGLYSTEDNDGTTYFYRGAVKNNYVSFAGFIWRIIRINGDGSIRMIYSGTSTDATGTDTSIGTSAYNSKGWDPTYVGYTYDDSSFVYRENTTLTIYYNIQSTYVYYYGKGISCNDETRKCTLTGDTMSGVWSEVHDEVLNNGYNYTCFGTSANATCNVAFKLDSYVSKNSAKVYYISYNSPDYETTLQDTTDSTIKTKIDNWYKSNILNKQDSNGVNYTDYIENNATFCNDRSIYSGSGYLLSSTTIYKAYDRLINKYQPSLKCNQASDIYRVSKGNLDYPIALITADEVAYAGGKHNNANTEYYLYTGQAYWTMTSSQFTSTSVYDAVWYVYTTGYLQPWYSIMNLFGVRPVINIKSSVSITEGIGTKEKPYQLEFLDN